MRESKPGIWTTSRMRRKHCFDPNAESRPGELEMALGCWLHAAARGIQLSSSPPTHTPRLRTDEIRDKMRLEQARAEIDRRVSILRECSKGEDGAVPNRRPECAELIAMRAWFQAAKEQITLEVSVFLAARPKLSAGNMCRVPAEMTISGTLSWRSSRPSWSCCRHRANARGANCLGKTCSRLRITLHCTKRTQGGWRKSCACWTMRLSV
jgi:hypothetical protein